MRLRDYEYGSPQLQRLQHAKQRSYPYVLQKLKGGRKRPHCIWYVFPQLKGLGHSYNSKFYGISGLDEAKAYLKHPVLGARLREVSEVILGLPTDNPREIFGGIDSRKLLSSMTLFDQASPEDIFADVHAKFYDSSRCPLTLSAL